MTIKIKVSSSTKKAMGKIGRRFAHVLKQPLNNPGVKWSRDIDIWLPDTEADPAIHVMGPAHTDGLYMIRYINEEKQLTEPVWTATSQAIARGELQKALNYLALGPGAETVPGTNVPIEWSDYNAWSQQRVFMDPMKFLDLCGAPLGGFSVPSIKGIAEGLESGHALEALYLDVDVEKMVVERHEGRHRAYYAWKQGWPYVPVILYHHFRNLEGFLRMQEVETRIDVNRLKSEASNASAGDYARKGIMYDPEDKG